MANTEKRDVIITLSSGQALSSIKDLQGAMRKLRKEFRETNDEGSRKKIAAEMKNINGQLSKQYALTRSAKSGWDKLSGSIMKMGGLIAGMMGFQIITEQVGNLIRKGAELSDQMADVQKTTGLTEKQVKDLDKSLRKINTRSSRKELLQLARDAGKLGKNSVADVQKFVEQADKINVALGEDLGEGALVTIGKLSNIFKTDMLKIGSAINEVGASSEASEPALVEFLSRLGGIATTAKLSAPDIIGYGATLDALGLKAEMSTTALNTFFIDFIKNSEEMGKVAGFAEGEISKLIGTEGTNAGFVAFLEKLRETHPEQKQFLQALEQMGIDGARGSQVFLTLANNTEMLRKQQDIANDSFEKGTSIIDEFNVKNNNFAANLARIQKAIGRAFTSSAMMQGIEALVNGVSDYMKVPLSQKLSKEQSEMNALSQAIFAAADNQDLRQSLISELMQKYPKYFGQLDKEKTTNEQIRDILTEVNALYLERIKLASLQEELAEIEAQGVKLITAQREGLKNLMTDRLFNQIKSEAEVEATELAAIYSEIMEAYKAGRMAEVDDDIFNAVILKLTRQLAYEDQINANLQKRAELMGDVAKQQNNVPKDSDFVGPENFDYDSFFAQLGAKGTELTDKEKKAQQELADQTKKFIQELEDLKIQAIDNVEQRDIAAAEAAYQRKVAEVEQSNATEKSKNDLIKQLTIDLENEKTRITADAHQARLEEEAARVAAANDSELLTLQLKVDVAPEGSKEQLRAMIALLTKQMELELSSLNLTNEQKLLITKDYQQRAQGLWDEYFENLKDQGEDFKAWEDLTDQERIDRVGSYLSQIGDMWGDLLDTISSFYDVQLENEKSARDQQLEKAEQDLNNGILTQEQFAAKRTEIEERYAKKEREIKHKQFEIEKTANMIKATMAMAQAINVAMSGGPVIGQVLAGITAGLAGLQIGIISAQPNPYLFGGQTDQITDSQGNRHRAKNIGSFADNYGYYSTPSYGVVAEDGKPELVVPNHVLTNPNYAEAIAQIEGAIYRRDAAMPFINGGYTNSSSSGDGSAAAPQQSSSSDPRLLRALEMNNQFLGHLIQHGVEGVFDFQKFVDGVINMEEIENRKYFGGESRKPGKRP